MTDVDICNQALAHIGDQKITRLDEVAQQSNPVIRYCAEFYRQARREALAAHRWTFAKNAVAMSRRTGVVTIGGYSYVHALPEDTIRLMELYPGSVPSGETEPTFSIRPIDKFKKVGKNVWSNSSELAVFYIQDVLNPNDWSPHFVTCVARLLAHYVSGPIADDPQMAMRHREHYEKVDLPNAQFYDAVQDSSGENADTETRLARSPSYMSRQIGDFPSEL